ncbi:MAG: ATP-binding protein [Thermodesulfobacteriota bacterium]
MKVLRKIIEIDENLCTGCGECVPACAEGALRIVNGKAKMIADKYCDGLGACLGECPVGALRIIEREADDFDEEAVHELLARQKAEAETAKPAAMACGCPSSQLQSFAPATPCQTANQPIGFAGTGSALTHWPVQIRLVPPSAPFLKGADLLIAADCVPVAYPAFHAGMLSGKAVMMGCPKFDDAESYIAKFSEIFATSGINSITMAIMEVPCCGTMRGIVKEALRRAGKEIPVRELVVSAQGQILKDGSMA